MSLRRDYGSGAVGFSNKTNKKRKISEGEIICLDGTDDLFMGVDMCNGSSSSNINSVRSKSKQQQLKKSPSESQPVKKVYKRSRRQKLLESHKDPSISSSSAANSNSAASCATGKISVPCFESKVLQLDFTQLYHGIRCSRSEAEVEGNTSLRKYSSDRLRHVPTHFTSAQEYAQVFLPLILNECIHHVISSVLKSGIVVNPWVCVMKKYEKQKTNLHVQKANMYASMLKDIPQTKSSKNSQRKSDSLLSTSKAKITFVVEKRVCKSTKQRDLSRENFNGMSRSERENLIRTKERKISKRSCKKSLVSIGKGELLLLSPSKTFVMENSGKGSCIEFERLSSYNLGLVTCVPKLLFYCLSHNEDPTGCSYEIRVTMDVIVPNQLFHKQSSWVGFFWLLDNVITCWREYEAVEFFLNRPSTSFLKHAILSGKKKEAESPYLNVEEELTGICPRYKDWLGEKYNASQKRAILSAVGKRKGLSLIQGPPGTGKTYTLLGLLNTFHLNVSQQHSKNQMDAVKDKALDRSKSEGVTTGEAEMNAKKPRILVTAPSNTAVDGIGLKLLENGFRDGKIRKYMPRIVRIGQISSASEKTAAFLNQISLESQAEKLRSKLQHENVDDVKSSISKLKKESKKLLITLKEIIQSKLGGDAYKSCAKKLLHIDDKLNRLTTKYRNLLVLSDSRISRSQKNKKLRASILEDAQIVLATLSSSALTEIVDQKEKFQVVVIDEAGQAVEPSVLVPLQYKAERCVLVGDPAQLPATVTSESAAQQGYEQSLFERVQKCGYPCYFLDTQYRCHPDISAFPSRKFYNSKLKDGDNVKNPKYRLWSHRYPSLGPLVFFNINGKESKSEQSLSYRNTMEAELVLNIYKTIRSFSEKAMKSVGIGVITPYSGQVELLRNMFRSRSQMNADRWFDLNTVDGYQGREFDIIILSCVRGISDQNSGLKKGIGFLKDVRRLNVAITRAKFSLFVVGNERVLNSSPLWASFIRNIKQRGKIIHVNSSSDNILRMK